MNSWRWPCISAGKKLFGSGRRGKKASRAEDGVECVIACGYAYGEKGYDLEQLLAEADRRMYEDKKAKKAARG